MAAPAHVPCVGRMVALLPSARGARSAWMRNAMLVMALAGEPGAELEVPGASLWRDAHDGAFRLVRP